jgi:two-component system, sensor histidine kinase PdtaS
MLNCNLLVTQIYDKCIAMKRQVLCYILMFSCVGVFARADVSKKTIDSLLILVNKASVDTVKVNLYQKICEKFSTTDFVNIKKYSDIIARLSKKNNYKKGWGFYYINLSALEVYQNNEKAILYAKRAKAFLATENDNFHYLLAVRFLAFAYVANSQLKEAIQELEQHLALLYTIDNNNLKVRFYYILGAAYTSNSQPSKAILALKKAVQFFNVSTNNENKLSVYSAISSVYEYLEFYDESLNYLNQAQLVCESVYNRNILYHQQVSIFLDMGLFDKAYPLAQKNYNFFNDAKGTFGYFISLHDLALCNLVKKKYALALSQLKITEKAKDNNEIVLLSSTKIARCYFELKQFKKAKDYIDKVVAKVDVLTDNHAKLDVFLTKSDVESALHNYERALFFKDKYASLSQQMNKTLKQEQVLVLQADLSITEKENKIKTMQVTALQKNSQIDKQRRYLMYGGIGLVLALLGIVVFIKVYRTIKHKNNLINIKNVALSVANQEVEKSLTVKETLLKEIHHRVKNNLQLVMSLLYVQSKEKGTSMEDFLEISQSRIISMSLIHENLYQTDDLSKVDFKEYVNSLTQSILGSYNKLQKDIQLNIEVEGIYLDIQTAIPLGLIINELISNAYKHAFVNKNKGTILLALKHKDNSFELVLEDNGVGMTDTLATKKTLGLELVKQLVDQINGILKIDGTTGMRYHIEFKNLTV